MGRAVGPSGLPVAQRRRSPSPLRIIWAIALREMRGRFGRRRLGYVWSFIEPTLYGSTALAWFVLSGSVTPVDLPQILFLLTGFAPWFFFYRLDQYVRFAYARNVAMLYHADVRPLHLLLGRWFLEAPTGLFFIGLVFLGYCLIMNEPRAIPHNWGAIAVALALDALMALGFAGIIGTVLLRFEGLGWALGFSVRVVFMTAGLNFVPDYLPVQWQPIVFWNPMTHIIIEFRRGFLPEYPSHLLDLGFVIDFTLGLILIALILERFVARQLVKHTS